MFSEAIRQKAEKVIEALVARGEMLVTAESCTAGLVAAALTTVPGSSDAIHGGFVTYANGAKMRMLGVPKHLLESYGAVSLQCARAMADGARNKARVDVAIAITGIAGPGGATDKKPVGLVHFAVSTASGTATLEKRFGDIGRDKVREQSVLAALDLVLTTLDEQLAQQ